MAQFNHAFEDALPRPCSTKPADRLNRTTGLLVFAVIFVVHLLMYFQNAASTAPRCRRHLERGQYRLDPIPAESIVVFARISQWQKTSIVTTTDNKRRPQWGNS